MAASGGLLMPTVMLSATPHGATLSPAWWSNPLANPLLMGMGALMGHTPQAASTPAGGGMGGFLTGQGSGGSSTLASDAPPPSAASLRVSQPHHQQQQQQQDAARQPPASAAHGATQGPAEGWSADAPIATAGSSKPSLPSPSSAFDARAALGSLAGSASGVGGEAGSNVKAISQLPSPTALRPGTSLSASGGILGAILAAQQRGLVQSLPGAPSARPPTLPGFSPSLFLKALSPTNAGKDLSSPNWLTNALTTPKVVPSEGAGAGDTDSAEGAKGWQPAVGAHGGCEGSADDTAMAGQAADQDSGSSEGLAGAAVGGGGGGLRARRAAKVAAKLSSSDGPGALAEGSEKDSEKEKPGSGDRKRPLADGDCHGGKKGLEGNMRVGNKKRPPPLLLAVGGAVS
jgi:hypothetical protein